MNERIPKSPPNILALPEIERPVWSVIIPVYNCINYLTEALESVLRQAPSSEFMQIEVVDDCSTDGDVEKLVNHIGKGRVGYYRQKENRGSLRNFETCINRSKGKYVHLLHGDDRVEGGFYEEIENLFRDHPEAGAAFTNFHYIDHESQIVPIFNKSMLEAPGIVPDFMDKIGVKQLIQPPAMVVKRSTYEAVGSFYAVHFGEDWEMWARIGSRFPMACSPKCLASYRAGHGIGISHKSYLSGQNIKDIKKVINIIQQHLPENQRSKIRKKAHAYHAKFSVRVANTLLLCHKKAAFRQAYGAWGMSRDFVTLFWLLRFYAMYGLRYKQIEHIMRNRKHISKK
ncbi:glycosyltransferase family 2 protein [Zunongwangia sp. F260]|uniref:Glycosyltransferase family 2 protein n=1 Tax=Autumnicola lenta TaxID=3075593 RepID=A0ABU3CPN5_9FLAO|nr:glycosyltransferase family 2 protein [Zunongwangia sp. F260]MDT0648302.1 glycosyltransferase family 2 protein [Zunongwangia sp. F260]